MNKYYRNVIFFLIVIILIIGGSLKRFILILLITFGITLIPSFIVGSNVDNLTKPFLYPPQILFPIVWSILYFLMSISYYIVSKEDKSTSKIYYLQLIVNALWPVIFFGLEFRLLGFLWIILLIILVIMMFIKFYRINKTSGYLLVHYLIWLFFAGYLNLAFYLLN